MARLFQRNKKGILLMLVSSICACVGQMLWKLSSEQGLEVMGNNNVFFSFAFMTANGLLASLFLKRASGVDGIVSLLKNVNLYIGGGLYLLSAVINNIILKQLAYSSVLPLTSITYIWTMLLSCLILEEKITKRKGAGVVLIIIGAVIISALLTIQYYGLDFCRL